MAPGQTRFLDHPPLRRGNRLPRLNAIRLGICTGRRSVSTPEGCVFPFSLPPRGLRSSEPIETGLFFEVRTFPEVSDGHRAQHRRSGCREICVLLVARRVTCSSRPGEAGALPVLPSGRGRTQKRGLQAGMELS